ncbi:MAG TPA: ATP-binding protein [Gemmatimonadales bacterium]|nr:ATP-binding protein [Gemmatimonadales bacterium]
MSKTFKGRVADKRGAPLSTAALAQAITELVSSSRRPVRSAEIGKVLKDRFPGLQFSAFGVDRLRDFIRIYVPAVSAATSEAGEISYSRASSVAPKALAPVVGVRRQMTLAELTGAADETSDRASLLLRIRSEALRCREAGDTLGSGEWFVSMLPHTDASELDEVFAKAIASWGSPLQVRSLPPSMAELAARTSDYVPDHLATSLVCVTARHMERSETLPEGARDLAYRLAAEFDAVYEVGSGPPRDLCVRAATRVSAARAELLAAVDSFLRTTAITAKTASIQLVRAATRLRPLTVPAERPILSDLSSLLGPAFRKFCEACERQQSDAIAGRAPDLRLQLTPHLSAAGARETSTLWQLAVLPVCKKLASLVEEAVSATAAATAPDLAIAHTQFKLDLTQVGHELTISTRLLNRGNGRAKEIHLRCLPHPSVAALRVVEPHEPFDIPASSEQAVTLGLTLGKASASVRLDLRWESTSVTGEEHSDHSPLEVLQQQKVLDWNRFLEDPPYSLNPVKRRERLFGRDAILAQLQLNASARNSTFLWGQKRVGKTSVLEVLVSELRQRQGYTCCILRMGELKALHEGQLAHRIAVRLVAELSSADVPAPEESSIGAGLGGLVPFADQLTRRFPDRRFLVVIDEFDDIDSSFYTGQRGEAFVKALRSLSEVGLTFFLVGSERMKTIYTKHAMELNKWADVYLDRIESHADCRALVAQPVAGAIEFDDRQVDLMIAYCAGNPYYLQLLCSHVFQYCFRENRTYVGEGEVADARKSLLRSLGETSFAHLWADNPVLDPQEQARCTAENALVLTCIARNSGRYDGVESLSRAQKQLSLASGEQVTEPLLRGAADRLRQRGILGAPRPDGSMPLSIPLFQEWLAERAELVLLPAWRQHCVAEAARRQLEAIAPSAYVPEATFPVSEEELFEVAQRLSFCGKQKDVSELRIWLRQFDDDVRIDIAYSLLRRLAERGYISEGKRLLALTRVDEAILARRREIGGRVWREMRGRLENLCITYVDSDTKSGGATARDLAKRRRPGKYGASTDLDDWILSHLTEDPLVIVVDEFTGTGRTLSDGLRKFLARPRVARELTQLLRDGRVACYTLFAFPEALDRLRIEHPDVHLLAAEVFGDDVRALDASSGVFTSQAEIDFAREVLLQYGRALYREHPLGFGDMAALVTFHNTVPNNTLPIFWSNGTVNDRPWLPLFPRA